jgi:tetratricopeptide (TPR) repeat protein
MRKLGCLALVVGVIIIADGFGCSKHEGQRERKVSMLDDASLYGIPQSQFSEQYAAAVRLVAQVRFPEAEKLYRKLADEDTNSPDAFVGLGSCCFERGDLSGALELYKRARERGSNSLGVLVGLGSVYLVQSDYSNAIVEYEAALKVQEACAEAHYGLAFVQARAGQRGLARSHLDRFRQLAPASSRIRDLEQLVGPSTPPDGSANRGQPAGSETTRTAAAAGPGG